MACKRKGMGKGRGKGYRNLISKDKKVHADSAKGRKQPQSERGIHPMYKAQAETFRRQVRAERTPQDIIDDIDTAFKNEEKRIIEDVKNSEDGIVQITYGIMPTFRYFFNEDLDEEYMYKLPDDKVEEANWAFEEMENRLANKGITLIGDEGDGTVVYAVNEKGLKKYQKEMGFED